MLLDRQRTDTGCSLLPRRPLYRLLWLAFWAGLAGRSVGCALSWCAWGLLCCWHAAAEADP